MKQRIAFTAFLISVCGVGAGSAVAQTSPPTLNVPNTSSAPPAGSPVEVEDCKLQEKGGLVAAKTGKLIVEFTNESNVTADLVRFKIGWGTNDAAFIRDQGTFAPGITIKHEFRQSEGALISPLFSHPNLSCAVEEVHFTDGTQWTAPQSTASAPPPLDSQTQAEPIHLSGSGYIGAQLREEQPGVVTVHLVAPGSPADISGLKQNDAIKTINGESVADVQEATDLISSSPRGIVLKFVVIRNGSDVILRIKVGERPSAPPPQEPR